MRKHCCERQNEAGLCEVGKQGSGQPAGNAGEAPCLMVRNNELTGQEKRSYYGEKHKAVLPIAEETERTATFLKSSVDEFPCVMLAYTTPTPYNSCIRLIPP
jgi:hypothetical protein